MTKIAQLKEQAQVLRTLAGSFDIPTIREQLLQLAQRCEELARLIEEDARQPTG